MVESKIPVATGSGFGIANIAGILFIVLGTLLVIVLVGIPLPIDLETFQTPLSYGAALGSILGGLVLFLRRSADKVAMLR